MQKIQIAPVEKLGKCFCPQKLLWFKQQTQSTKNKKSCPNQHIVDYQVIVYKCYPKLRESLKPYLGGARQFQAIAFSEFVTITIILTP